MALMPGELPRGRAGLAVGVEDGASSDEPVIHGPGEFPRLASSACNAVVSRITLIVRQAWKGTTGESILIV